MKSFYKYLFIVSVFLLGACDDEYINPNEPSEESVYSSVDGFLSVCIGLKADYSTTALNYIIYVPGITTREIGTTSTYQTPMDLTYGGTSITNLNTGVSGLWSSILKDKGQAEDLIASIDQITMTDGIKNGIQAYACYFKALTLCNLYQSFEQFPLMNSEDGDAVFSTGTEGLEEAVNLLDQATEKLNAGISEEVTSAMEGMDLKNCIKALQSRLYLYHGDYDECIAAAKDVDLTSTSTFSYDNENYNPVYDFAVNGSPYLLPKDNFGLKDSYVPDEDDQRYAFYLSGPDTTELEELGGAALKQIVGFFHAYNTEIPVYLPGEMLLNIAEAYTRNNDLPNAVIYTNQVMTKTDDIYGLNAAMPDQTIYLSSLSKADLLGEIYKQRCIELFFTGQRLADSRRFHPDLQFDTSYDLSSERNRNYYPYPQQERDNNPNCPDDPDI